MLGAQPRDGEHAASPRRASSTPRAASPTAVPRTARTTSARQPIRRRAANSSARSDAASARCASSTKATVGASCAQQLEQLQADARDAGPRAAPWPARPRRAAADRRARTASSVSEASPLARSTRASSSCERKRSISVVLPMPALPLDDQQARVPGRRVVRTRRAAPSSSRSRLTKTEGSVGQEFVLGRPRRRIAAAAAVHRLRGRRGQRERQGLRCTRRCAARRLRLAPNLLERDRHRRRWTTGAVQRGLGGTPRAAGSGERERPVGQMAGAIARDRQRRVARRRDRRWRSSSPCTPSATPGVNAPNVAGAPSASDSVAGTVPPTPPASARALQEGHVAGRDVVDLVAVLVAQVAGVAAAGGHERLRRAGRGT